MFEITLVTKKLTYISWRNGILKYLKYIKSILIKNYKIKTVNYLQIFVSFKVTYLFALNNYKNVILL